MSLLAKCHCFFLGNRREYAISAGRVPSPKFPTTPQNTEEKEALANQSVASNCDFPRRPRGKLHDTSSQKTREIREIHPESVIEFPLAEIGDESPRSRRMRVTSPMI